MRLDGRGPDEELFRDLRVAGPGTGTEQENSWRAFDDDTGTYPDTLEEVSWIEVRLGTDNATALDAIRIYPRASHITRANGTIFQGSNDDGETWDDHNGRCNLAEVELLAMVNDTTLLSVLLDEAAVIDRCMYTEESLAVLDAAVELGESVLADAGATQEEIDDASAQLLAAIDGSRPQ